MSYEFYISWDELKACPGLMAFSSEAIEAFVINSVSTQLVKQYPSFIQVQTKTPLLRGKTQWVIKNNLFHVGSKAQDGHLVIILSPYFSLLSSGNSRNYQGRWLNTYKAAILCRLESLLPSCNIIQKEARPCLD